MNIVSPYFCEAVTVDTRAPQVKWFKTMADAANELDENKFKAAIKQMEGRFNSPALVTENVVSSYGFVNENHRYYTPSYGVYNSKTLVRPFPKPVLKNHDRYEDPLGRVINSYYTDIPGLTEAQKTDLKTRVGHVKAFAYITGADNIEKIMDERFLTLSIAGVSPEVRCSICDVNLVHQTCDHELGEMYEIEGKKGKHLCYLKYGPQEYREFSYVSTPADTASRTQRYHIIAPQDSIVSDYSELVHAAMKAGRGFDDPYLVEDSRYYMGDQDIKSKMLFCFNDSNEYAYDSLFKNIPASKVAKETADTVEKPNETKSNEDQKSKEVKVTLEEARLEDVLKLGIVKDHIENLRKNDAQKIQTLDDKVKEQESAISSKDEEINSLKEQIKTKDEEIKTLKADLDKHADSEKKSKVEQLVDLYIKLEKPQAADIITEADGAKKAELRTKLIEKVSQRSADSINDAIADLEAEVSKKDGESDNANLSQKVEGDVDVRDSKKTGDGKKDASSPIAKILDKKD